LNRAKIEQFGNGLGGGAALSTPLERTEQPALATAGTDPSDESLLAAIVRGDHDALGVLYDRYHRLAMAVAYRVLNDHGTAEDVVHDAFLTVWRRGESFNAGRGTVRSWLLTVVRNAAIDRRRGRHARALQDASLDNVAFLLSTEKEEIFATVAAGIEAGRVREALTALPAEQRETIELAYFRGLTQHEIAAQTGAALGTVKGRMRLGLQKMRVSLFDLRPTDSAPTAPVRDNDVSPEQTIARPALTDIVRGLLGTPFRRFRFRPAAVPA
jgi:RNA polymerase sigma-70 factor (ECF subfamily)